MPTTAVPTTAVPTTAVPTVDWSMFATSSDSDSDGDSDSGCDDHPDARPSQRESIQLLAFCQRMKQPTGQPATVATTD